MWQNSPIHYTIIVEVLPSLCIFVVTCLEYSEISLELHVIIPHVNIHCEQQYENIHHEHRLEFVDII